MTFSQAIRTTLTEKYFTLEGRASRSEFWYLSILLLSATLLVEFFMSPLAPLMLGLRSNFLALTGFFTAVCLALIIPGFTVMVRRVHDRGLSFWWYLGAALALAVILAALDVSRTTAEIWGWIVCLALTVPQGSVGENRFGPDPCRDDPPPAPAEPLWRSHPRLTAAPVILVLLAAAIDHANRYTIDDYATVHADGSIEYTLLDKGRDNRRDTDDDGLWVLHFPPGLNVEPGGMSSWRKQHRNPGARLNRFVTLAVTLPDFTNRPGHFEDHPDTTLEIRIWSHERPFDPAPGDGDRINRKSFQGAYLLRSTMECRMADSFAPGIIRLRAPTKAETAALKASLGDKAPGYLPDCRTYGGSHQHYAVHDDRGQPLGLGHCRKSGNAQAPDICTFRLWLAQDRMVHYRFNANHLVHLHKMHAFTTDLLARSTVKGKSRNLRLP